MHTKIHRIQKIWTTYVPLPLCENKIKSTDNENIASCCSQKGISYAPGEETSIDSALLKDRHANH